MTETTTQLPAIERTLDLDASPERVWRAISEPAELAMWFPQKAEWDLRAGGQGIFYWEGHGHFQVRVEAVVVHRYLSWRWGEHPDRDPAEDESATLVEWWLEPRPGGGTTLRVRESGFRSETRRQDNEKGWTAELAELKELVERP